MSAKHGYQKRSVNLAAAISSLRVLRFTMAPHPQSWADALSLTRPSPATLTQIHISTSLHDGIKIGSKLRMCPLYAFICTCLGYLDLGIS